MRPDHKSKGLKGWPAGQTLSQFRPRLDGYGHTSIHKRIPRLRVGGNRADWPAGHVDGCPVIHHLQTDSIKSVEPPIDLYIRILMVELTHTTLSL
jgi:hypothetical protein